MMSAISHSSDRYLLKVLQQRAGRRKTLRKMRQDMNAFGALYPPATNVTIRAMTVGGRPAEMLTPAEHYSNYVLLYLHGGGFVMGSIQSHRQLASHLSAAAKIKTLITEYRLAPEHPFPAALVDALSVYKDLLKSGVAPRHVTVAGDSAGGGLCVSLMVLLKQNHLPLPGACVLFSPWVDLTLSGHSWHRNFDRDVLVKKNDAKRMAAFYLNGKDPFDHLSSPIYADLSMLPPLLIQVGSDEVLHDDAVSLHVRATKFGVSSYIDIWDKMPHVWHFMSPVLREGRMALHQAGKFIMTHMQGGYL
ncbi:MAG: alpha/beta hydrolase [Desulfobacteraceae bacterium]|nr:alpha/beta hydrolase [Desulfobacteraceae bacterium]MBC2750772.1 alpha/beta hydrolase [Desulfobacteraceae bacterium]